MQVARRGTAGVLLVAALVLGALAALGAPREVSACSIAGIPHPTDADAIIAGYAVGLEVLPTVPDTSTADARVIFTVDRYLLGSGPHAIAAVAGASIHREPADGNDIDDLIASGRVRFGGLCGELREGDPRGRYWVLGLHEGEGGYRLAGPWATFGLGAGPDDPDVLAAIELVEEAIREGDTPGPATSGNADLVRHGQRATGSQTIALGLAALAVILLGRYASRDGGRR
jgi:hypothetical protein